MNSTEWTVCIGVAVAAWVGGMATGERFQPFARLVALWAAYRAARSQRKRGIEIYVGNLAYDVSDHDLAEAFRAHGRVLSARVIRDRMRGRSKGYGFVRMLDSNEARDAIRALNGSDLKGRRLVVNEARSQSRAHGGGGR